MSESGAHPASRRQPQAQQRQGREHLFQPAGGCIGAGGPAFLEVVVDPDANVYPMVGPGASYAQMLTGDFIPARAAAVAAADEEAVPSMF